MVFKLSSSQGRYEILVVFSVATSNSASDHWGAEEIQKGDLP